MQARPQPIVGARQTTLCVTQPFHDLLVRSKQHSQLGRERPRARRHLTPHRRLPSLADQRPRRSRSEPCPPQVARSAVYRIRDSARSAWVTCQPWRQPPTLRRRARRKTEPREETRETAHVPHTNRSEPALRRAIETIAPTNSVTQDRRFNSGVTGPVQDQRRAAISAARRCPRPHTRKHLSLAHHSGLLAAPSPVASTASSGNAARDPLRRVRKLIGRARRPDCWSRVVAIGSLVLAGPRSSDRSES